MGNSYVAENIIVALDFDGVIAFGEPAKIKYVKILHSLDVNENQITKDTYPLGPKKYRELMDQVGSKYIMDFALAPKCKEVLDTLYIQGFRFVIVTSRFDFEFEACKDFCKFHKLPIKYFHNTNESSKDYLCNKLHVRAMIDDTLSKLTELKTSPFLRFYYNAPWNAHIRTVDKDFINVKSWKEFYDWLIYVKQMHEAISYNTDIKNNVFGLAALYNFWRDNPALCKKYLKDYTKESKTA